MGKPSVSPHSLSIVTWLSLVFVIVMMLGAAAVSMAIRYQEDVSVRSMAESQARRFAELTFQNLYSVMRRGWSREEMNEIISRINQTSPEVRVSVVRSQQVAEQFGEIPEAAEARNHDPVIGQVFATGTQALERSGDRLRFVYPLVVEAECTTCHASSPPGSLNGVIDMSFPVGELRVPLEFSLRVALYTLGATLAALFLVMFLKMRFLIVRPIIDLAGVMRAIMDSNDLGRRISVRPMWPSELRILAQGFNALMTEVEENRAELVEQSLRDPLTGLFNRRRFDAGIAREFERTRRYPGNLSVLAVDLDGFKPINDHYGHAAGDQMLAHVARLLRSNVRATDMVARVGGDEFSVLLPMTDLEAARKVAHKLTTVIESSPVQFENHRLAIGVSIGAADMSSKPDGVIDLLSAADADMYAIKQQRKRQKDAATSSQL